jgi:hypothetical protein
MTTKSEQQSKTDKSTTFSEDEVKFLRKEWLLDRLLNVTDRWYKLVGIAFAFLGGQIVNLSTDQSGYNVVQLLSRMYNSPFSIVAVLFILLSWPGRWVLRQYLKARSFNVRLARLYRDKIEAFLQPSQRGRIGWGTSLTLQSCPELHLGWQIRTVQIEHDSTKHSISGEIGENYKDYLATEFRHRYTDDKTRLMLIENPAAFSDSPTLRLRVRETTWSQVQFYQRRVFSNPNQRDRHIEKVFGGEIDFPNSLCLHVVVASQDGYLLRTQASHKVAYYPEQWAVSIGEQLDLSDLVGPHESFALNWVNRALWEELGIAGEGVRPENIRVMALFLEGEIVNVALATVAILKYDKSELNAIIDKHPRTDYEFQNWDFMSWDEIPKELIRPSRLYHPSTGIRMFYAGLYKFGAPGLNMRNLAIARK